MSHPIHPKCPGCGKPLYKAFHVGKKVHKDWGWDYCRNVNVCKRAGPDGIAANGATAVKPPAPPVAETPKPVEKSQPVPKSKQKMPRRARPSQGVPPPKPAEPPELAKARIKLRGMIQEATKDRPPVAIGLVLAILNQETGAHAAANLLIDEFKLEEKFGIHKFTANSPQ